MLKGLKFKHELGAGANAIADIYEDSDGSKFVLRTMVLPFNSVFINEKGNYQIIYRNSYNGIISEIDQELCFFRLIANMPDEESKHFIKLIRYDVTKSPDKQGNEVRFDANRLKSNNALAHTTEISKRIYLRQLLEYAGNTLSGVIDSYGEKEAEKVINQVLLINKITRKYKWHIWDLHLGNLCITSNGIVKLIDCSSVMDMHEDYQMGGVASAVTYYKCNLNLIVILSIACGITVFSDTFGWPHINEALNRDIFANMIKSKKFSQIQAIMNHIYKGTRYEHYVKQSMQDIKNGNYITEYTDFRYILQTLLFALDRKHFTDFWKTKIETIDKLRPLTSQKYIDKLLGLIYRRNN